MSTATEIRQAIETGNVDAVRVLASENGRMHGLWNAAMDAIYGTMRGGVAPMERMAYLLSRWERFGFC